MKPIFYMMVGIVGSGKSTQADIIANKIKDCTVVSSDAIREELFDDVNSQVDNNKVFAEVHKRIIERLKSGKSVVFDATNINSKKRQGFLKQLEHVECEKVCYVMATPIEKCYERNANRDRVVPEFVIDRMYKSFEFPAYFEGWDLIIPYGRKLDEQKGRSIYRLLDATIDKNYTVAIREYGKIIDLELYNIDQENKHHNLPIIEHCIETAFNIADTVTDASLLTAGIFHDVSKHKVKSMVDEHGEPVENATYYQHHCVSAYDTVCMLMFTAMPLYIIVEACALISHHMRLHTTKEDKGINNLHERVGDEFFNKLKVLHEADTKAKTKTY